MDLSRRELLWMLGSGATLLGAAAAAQAATPVSAPSSALTPAAAGGVEAPSGKISTVPVMSDPTKIPPPISRNHSVHHQVEFEAVEALGEIEPGAPFTYMTFNGQTPGPMIRVRVGDTVELTLHNKRNSGTWHSLDLHAVYGPGGGADDLTVLPGQTRAIAFKATYPGAFIYHCAVPGEMDKHMALGMFGMIVVEPEGGLPHVDREFYLGQNEIYTKQPPGSQGPREFDFERMLAENPTYVVFNGVYRGLTGPHAMKAKVGETVRVFLVNGGPNLQSSFHPIGNIWSRVWLMGSFVMPHMRFLQSVPIPPGNAIVSDMDLPVPQTIKLVDHAMSRALRKGAIAEIVVTGPEHPEIFRALPTPKKS